MSQEISYEHFILGFTKEEVEVELKKKMQAKDHQYHQKCIKKFKKVHVDPFGITKYENFCEIYNSNGLKIKDMKNHTIRIWENINENFESDKKPKDFFTMHVLRKVHATVRNFFINGAILKYQDITHQTIVECANQINQRSFNKDKFLNDFQKSINELNSQKNIFNIYEISQNLLNETEISNESGNAFLYSEDFDNDAFSKDYYYY